MNHFVSVWRSLGLAFLAVFLVVHSAAAQATNPNGTQYPYWGTAPQSYSGPQIFIPPPSISPMTISQAVPSPLPATSVGVGIGGGYLPPSLAAQEMGVDNKAHIWVRVPANAEIWIDGIKTKQTGEIRYFFSPPLTPGKKYSYQLRLRWTQDGKPVEQTQRLFVQAGEVIRRDFTRLPQ